MVEHFSGFQIDQAETEFLGATAEAVDQARAVKLIVGRGAGVAVGNLAAQDPVNQYGEFTGGGGDGLGLAQPVSQAAIVGAQRSRAGRLLGVLCISPRKPSFRNLRCCFHEDL